MRYSLKQTFIRLLVIFSSSVLLGGCAGMNSEFECKQPPGIHCKSLDEVNALIDSGQLVSRNDKETKPNQPGYSSKQESASDSVNHTLNNSELPDIWLTGYEDNQHYYHNGHWLKAVEPVNGNVPATLSSNSSQQTAAQARS